MLCSSVCVKIICVEVNLSTTYVSNPGNLKTCTAPSYELNVVALKVKTQQHFRKQNIMDRVGQSIVCLHVSSAICGWKTRSDSLSNHSKCLQLASLRLFRLIKQRNHEKIILKSAKNIVVYGEKNAST